MNHSLKDDLLADFREQKEVIFSQIELFEPIAANLRKPAAYRLMSKGGLIIAEIFSYLLCLSAIAFTILMNLIWPFTMLYRVRFMSELKGASYSDPEYFSIAVHVLGGLIALLLFILARTLRGIRLKNDVLYRTGKGLKVVMGQHLQRKASIETIIQRHYLELPPLPDNNPDVNSVSNPAYDI
jgi:hypothetical protein